MVQFGRRFQTSQTRRWQRHNADYARLKLLLDLACAARERASCGPIGLRNFEGPDNLLAPAGQFAASRAARHSSITCPRRASGTDASSKHVSLTRVEEGAKHSLDARRGNTTI